MNYNEQLKSPLWQKKRLEIMQRDNFTCQGCGSTENQLHVHHYVYKEGLKAWEHDTKLLSTMCEKCHSIYHVSEKYFNVPFLKLSAKGLLASGFHDNESYLSDMQNSFINNYSDFEEALQNYEEHWSLVFDSISRNTTYVMQGIDVDMVNRVLYVNHYWDAKY